MFRVVMLSSFLGLALIASAISGATGAEVPSTTEPLKGLIHVNFADEARHEGGLRSIEAILNELGDNQADLVVVCHNDGINLVLQEKSLDSAKVRALMERGVRFSACRNTMARKGLSPEDLIPGTGIVPSGALEVMRKQHEGYAYFRP